MECPKIRTDTYFDGMARRGTTELSLTARERELISILIGSFFYEHQMCEAFEEEIEVAYTILKKLRHKFNVPRKRIRALDLAREPREPYRFSD